MSHAFKRPFESNSSNPNGRRKWRKTGPSGSHSSPLIAPPSAIVFRIICPKSKSGSVIGKGGAIISRIRQETGARVKLEDIIPGCEERIVLITGSEKDNEVRNEHDKGGDAKVVVNNEEKDEKDGDENNVEKEESSLLDSSKPPEKEISSAQKALLHVFERIIEGESESNGDGEDVARKESSVTIKLLVMNSQVGYLLGKGGSIIKQMKSDSGANICVLPRDKIPACASLQDEIVQIRGEIDATRKALLMVSQLLIEHPPKDPFPSRSTHTNPRKEARSSARFHSPQGPRYSNRIYDNNVPHFPKFHDDVVMGPNQGGPEILVFRMLCSNDKVGSVIGKGGNIVKSLQLETGSEIKILETTPETGDRLIIISSPAIPADGVSPAQDGLLRVQQRIAMAIPDGHDNVLARLIVSSNQIGCVLGKGGFVINEMRKLSGANIRVLSRDQIPLCVSEQDELIQVSGELRTVQNALLQITDRLKNQSFHRSHAGHPPFIDQMQPPSFGAYFGRRDFSPPRMFPNYPPFQNDFPVHPYEERPPFPQGIPPHGLERLPPAPWVQQAMRDGGSMPMPEYPSGPPQRRIGGFAGGTPAFVATSTVEVTVPRAIIPSLCGEDGGCLRRIREISEAKISISESKPEAVETAIMIIGTSEQTHAAQSLIQAFVLSETAAT